VIELAVADLQEAKGPDLASAVAYLAERGGELERWHADFAGLDLAALRQRARRVLEQRLGPWKARKLWSLPKSVPRGTPGAAGAGCGARTVQEVDLG
jgi:hypothetical protein